MARPEHSGAPTSKDALSRQADGGFLLALTTCVLKPTDSLLEGTGFEPSVPLPRLSSIRAVRAEIIGRYGCLSARSRVRCLCRPGKTQPHLQKSVFDRPGSGRRWNLASTTSPDAEPMVRIRFPPSGSPV